MAKTQLQYRVRFGPFRTLNFRQQVDGSFRRAFDSYVDRQVIPCLEGAVVRVAGRVFSHYDRPQFEGLAHVSRLFFYELSLYSAGGKEEASGEVDYDRATGVWAPSRIKPPRVITLSEKRREKRQRDLERQISSEARHYHPVRPARCPQCNSKRVAEIVYGYVLMSRQLKAALRAGRVCLGGCMYSHDNPHWCCLACGNRWGLSARGLAKRQILRRMGGDPRRGGSGPNGVE